MKVLYFTATGNSLYVAKSLGGELLSIPQMIKEDRYEFEDEKIGIVFPIYHLGVPEYIEEFLNKVKLESDYIFAVMTYGLLHGDAISQLQGIAKRNGIHFSYINEVLMVNNYLPVYYMEKQKKNEPKKKIDSQITNINKDITHLKEYIKPQGILAVIFASTMRNTYMAIRDRKNGVYHKSFDRAFFVEDRCVVCGICGKVCPVDNIVLSGDKSAFKGQCIGCLSCTNNCPQNAIRVQGEKSKERFRNQHVKLNEIIETNK